MNEQELRNLISQVKAGSMSRRSFVQRMIALGLTALLGAAYINGICFAYTQMGFTVHDPSGVGILVYAITGLHLAMVGAGIIFIGLMAFRTLGGQYSARDHEGLQAAALYWYVTCAVYTAIWYGIFVTK